MSECKKAQSHHELIMELKDSCLPKTEREHAAVREIERLEQRLAAAEAKNTELEKELFVLSSDVIYFENQTMPYEIVRKAKRVYDELRRSEGE